MKFLPFLLFSLSVLSGVHAFGRPLAQKLKAVVGFEENSARLSEEAKAELRLFLSRSEGLVVEKIDIVALCGANESSFHTLKLSRERTQEVYRILTGELPDFGDYELRYFDPSMPEAAEFERSNCVIVTAYFLNDEVPILSDPPRELFPEEFADAGAMPTSLAKTSHPSIQKNSKENAKGAAKFTMQNIHFEGNSALYTERSEPTLNEVLAFLSRNPSYKVHLIGHVNGNMGRAYLKKVGKSNPERKVYKNAEHLSLARAESIRDFLVANGIDASRISCEGRGGKDKVYNKPRNERENEANRRIEIVLTR